jgi:hypothetical protein
MRRQAQFETTVSGTKRRPCSNDERVGRGGRSGARGRRVRIPKGDETDPCPTVGDPRAAYKLDRQDAKTTIPTATETGTRFRGDLEDPRGPGSKGDGRYPGYRIAGRGAQGTIRGGYIAGPEKPPGSGPDRHAANEFPPQLVGMGPLPFQVLSRVVGFIKIVRRMAADLGK